MDSKNNKSKNNNQKNSNSDKSKTKLYKVPKVKNANGKDKKKKEKKKSKHPKLMLFIKIMIILFLLVCVVGAGIVAGAFFGLFGDDFEITKDELVIGASNSVVVDKDGNIIANLSGDEKRQIITLEEMSDYLPKAFVAIEDKRFYEHNGVDIKRTAYAIFNFVVKRDSSFGGSTITQQLVKNLTNEKADEGLAGVMRKVKEWAKAYQVERMLTKNQILELYLNLIGLGGQSYGVEMAAQSYFNKSAKDLSLAECAYLAGINHAPSSYRPFSDDEEMQEKIKNRTKTV